MEALNWSTEKDEQLSNILTQVRESEEYRCVIIDQSVKGETICAYKDNDALTYLNSRYDAEYAAETWVDGIDNIKYKSLYVTVGISNGMYIRSLLKKLGKENDVIVYEPCAAIFLKIIENVDMTDIFQDRRVYIYVRDINDVFFRKVFKFLCRYERINYTHILFPPNYIRLFEREMNEAVQICEKVVKETEAEASTLYQYSDEMNDNMIENIVYIPMATSIDQLKKKIQEMEGYMNSPMIIVGAGPSLDKNIEELKNFKDKAFIVATDSAILAMLKHHIIPDLLVTIDPHKPLELFKDEITQNIPYVVCMQTRSEVMRLHKGKKFLFASDSISCDLYERYHKELSPLQTGGSVACNAFSLARFLEFKNIVLIGQDLAFTGNQKHVKEIYEDTDIDDEDSPYAYVKDTEGNDILTYANFKLYKEWFETEIAEMKGIRVINATEGGAYIEGAEHLTLKQVHEELCEKNYAFENMVNAADEVFNEGEKKELQCFVSQLPQTGLCMKNKLNETIELYKKMKWLIESGKINDSEFMDVDQKIRVNTLEFDRSPYMELVQMYAKEQEFKTLDGVYDASDYEKESEKDMQNVIDKGIQLLETYLNANEKVLKRLENIKQSL